MVRVQRSPLLRVQLAGIPAFPESLPHSAVAAVDRMVHRMALPVAQAAVVLLTLERVGLVLAGRDMPVVRVLTRQPTLLLAVAVLRLSVETALRQRVLAVLAVLAWLVRSQARPLHTAAAVVVLAAHLTVRAVLVAAVLAVLRASQERLTLAAAAVAGTPTSQRAVMVAQALSSFPTQAHNAEQVGTSPQAVDSPSTRSPATARLLHSRSGEQHGSSVC